MAKLNKPTLKQKESDFINRVAPFDGDPLIQKTEDLQLRDDHSDSQVFAIPEIQAINSPSAAFAVDFANGLRADIDTTGSVDTSFLITISNIDDGEKGVLKITKKSEDTFTFVNGDIIPANTNQGQDGLTSIDFNIFSSGASYFAIPLFDQESKIGVDGEIKPKIKEVNIGFWDMDTDATATVDTGIANLGDKILKISAYIGTDGSLPSTNYPIDYNPIGSQNEGGVGIISGSNIFLSRRTGGFFDSVTFSSGVINRGRLVIIYKDI